MSHLKFLTSKSPFVRTSLDVLVYAYLLSNSYEEQSKVYAEEASSEVIESLKKLAEKPLLEKALTNLSQSGMIKIYRGGKIELGTRITRGSYRFGFEEDKEEAQEVNMSKVKRSELFELLSTRYAEAYLSVSMDRRSKSQALDVSDMIKRLSAFKSFKPADYALLFTYAYEAVYQSSHRELMAKDYGQLKTLSKLYDKDTLCAMIIHYIIHVENYHKWPPTISSLLHYKDEIYFRLFNLKEGSKKALRIKDAESEF